MKKRICIFEFCRVNPNAEAAARVCQLRQELMYCLFRPKFSVVIKIKLLSYPTNSMPSRILVQMKPDQY